MGTKPYSFRLPEEVMDHTKMFCKEHGMSVTFFVEKSIKEHLENISDIKEFDRLFLEKESAVDVDTFLKELT